MHHDTEQALYQVQLLMNENDYDVASIMPPLAWWSQMFAANHADAKYSLMNILVIGKNICERVGAINDSTYVGILRFDILPPPLLLHCITDSMPLSRSG